MRLHVYVLEAKELPVEDTYVKLKLGRHKSKTRTVRNQASPVWNEEFVFEARRKEEEEELVVSVYGHDHRDDHLGLFDGSGELVGRVRIRVWSVLAEESQSLPPTWFPLEQPKSGKFVNVNCGKILLTASLHRKDSAVDLFVHADSNRNQECALVSSHGINCKKAPSRNILGRKKFAKTISSYIDKVFSKKEEVSTTDDSSDITFASSDYEDSVEEQQSDCNFDEAIELLSSGQDQPEMPDNLQGGVLLDQTYAVASTELNKFLFGPGSQFRRELAEVEKTTDLEEGPWGWKSADKSCLARTVTYTKAATKFVKAVKATEEQTYVRADGDDFAVLVRVHTPEVPYGNTFVVELLYKIIHEPDTPSGEESSRLIVSWVVNFHQSTMMKGMIEGAAKQGIKDSFDQFSKLLEQCLKNLDGSVDSSSTKEEVFATLEAEHESSLVQARDYFWNFTVISTIFMLLYVLVHILLCKSIEVQGLQISGFDLPDSFGELVTSGILIIQLEHVYGMVVHFIQARLRKGGDHGIKASGDGWILSVALIEATDLPLLDSTEFPDPYVVFTCNGMTRNSSIKLQTCDPQWNEVLEFDAMNGPPSVLDAKVFHFDGPFDQATSLGHAEINFVKYRSSELADMWVPLEGKGAQSSRSRLHLRIFLDNNKGLKTIKEYLSKVEKEVGKKLSLRSPQKNSAFRQLFGLPPEEFLISDFTCQLKRKMPLQGRLFLSARIMGFYANLFGHKSKFFFLWEDIEDIRVLPPTLSSVGSPLLVVVLRKGKGLEAQHWAKSQDEEGRLKFYFQSFVSFSTASRTIMAVRRARTSAPEMKEQTAEEQQYDRERSIALDDSDPLLDFQDLKITKIYSSELPIGIESVMQLFEGGTIEQEVMEKSGCLNYITTPWEPIKPTISERHLWYRFNRHVSIFGGEVSSMQQKSPLPGDGRGWVVSEVMMLQDVPFANHFNMKITYRIEESGLARDACTFEVDMGITWLKMPKFQQKISRSITDKFKRRLQEIIELLQRETVTDEIGDLKILR